MKNLGSTLSALGLLSTLVLLLGSATSFAPAERGGMRLPAQSRSRQILPRTQPRFVEPAHADLVAPAVQAAPPELAPAAAAAAIPEFAPASP